MFFVKEELVAPYLVVRIKNDRLLGDVVGTHNINESLISNFCELHAVPL